MELQAHPFLDWLGGPIGVALGWAIIGLLNVLTASIAWRIHERQNTLQSSIYAHNNECHNRSNKT